jgi:hypothetical protein
VGSFCEDPMKMPNSKAPDFLEDMKKDKLYKYQSNEPVGWVGLLKLESVKVWVLDLVHI